MSPPAFSRVGESVTARLTDPTRLFAASVAAIKEATGPSVPATRRPTRPAIPTSRSTSRVVAVVLSIVDGKIDQRDVVVDVDDEGDDDGDDDGDDEGDEGDDAFSVVRRILSAFPGTSRVFDARGREFTSSCSTRSFGAHAATWSDGYPVFWALGHSCVFYVDPTWSATEEGRAASIRTNFDFSSYALPAGERFEVRGTEIERERKTTFLPKRLATEAFECRVTRRRATSSKSKRPLELSLGPPHARRPIVDPTGLGGPPKQNTIDDETVRVFVLGLMRAYAPTPTTTNEEGWYDDITRRRWDPVNGPLVRMALALGEEDLVSVANAYGGECARFAMNVLRSPWLRTKNECDASRGACVPLGVTTEHVELEAGHDDSIRAWKTSLGRRSFVGWHAFPVPDCAWSCAREQSRQIFSVCRHDASYHFHEIRRCECSREFCKLCVCDEGRDVKTNLCPECGGYSQSAYDRIPIVCDECIAIERRDRSFGAAVPPRRNHRRAVMHSRCGHAECLSNRRRVAFECPCGNGTALANRQRDATIEFVEDVRAPEGLAFGECRIAIVVDDDEVEANDPRVSRAMRRVARIVRESVAHGNDTAFRLARAVGRESARRARATADFAISVVVDRDGTTRTDANDVLTLDAKDLVSSLEDDEDDEDDDENATTALLRKTTRDLLVAFRDDRGRDYRDDDGDDDYDDYDDCDDYDDGRDGYRERVDSLRTRESRSARRASRPYESYALNAEWNIESFTWTTLAGRYVSGKKHARCAHDDCSLDGSWPVGVVGTDGTCVACGVKRGPTFEHDEQLNEEHTRGVPVDRADVETMLRLVLSEYY